MSGVKFRQQSRSAGSVVLVVEYNLATERQGSPVVEPPYHGIQNCPVGVVQLNVDAVKPRGPDQAADVVGRTVVHGCRKSQTPGEPVHFSSEPPIPTTRPSASAAICPGTESTEPSAPETNDRVSRFRVSAVQHSEVDDMAVQSQEAEHRRDRCRPPFGAAEFQRRSDDVLRPLEFLETVAPDDNVA
jgi:hypothetical protein